MPVRGELQALNIDAAQIIHLIFQQGSIDSAGANLIQMNIFSRMAIAIVRVKLMMPPPALSLMRLMQGDKETTKYFASAI